MKNIFFVTSNQFETALLMEQKLLALPQESGILFAGVSVRQGEPERPLYKVTIGCVRERSIDAMQHLAKHYLREFVQEEKQIQVEAFRGVGRTP